MMRNALRDAKIDPSAIDYLNAHGTSTPVGDKTKPSPSSAPSAPIPRLAVSSTKSMTGHLLGGAGALEAGISVLAIRDQIAPPTINLTTPTRTAISTTCRTTRGP